MEQDRRKKIIRQLLDIVLILEGIALLFCLPGYIGRHRLIPGMIGITIFCMLCALFDLILYINRRHIEIQVYEPEETEDMLQKLVLLNEQGKPVKSWDLQGRTSLIIGKAGKGQELDVDLSDCEYSSFIDFQHAVLNFCMDQWYVEDLESQNGVRVKKVEDGECYRVIHRPCRVTAGDVLYIANTKLLMT